MFPTRTWPALLIAGVLLVLTLAGCGREEQEIASVPPHRTAESGSPEVSTEPDTPALEEGRDIGVAVGQFPPPFTLKDLSGNDVSLADFAGKVVVLDLWATWCAPCRAEIPFLVSLYSEFKDRGFVVVGVGLDDGGARVMRPFIESYGVTYPILVGSRSVQSAYRVTGIPTTFVIARSGRIAARHVGYRPELEGQMRSEVAELLEMEEEAA